MRELVPMKLTTRSASFHGRNDMITTAAFTSARTMRDWNEDYGGVRWKVFAARYSLPRSLCVGRLDGQNDAPCLARMVSGPVDRAEAIG